MDKKNRRNQRLSVGMTSNYYRGSLREIWLGKRQAGLIVHSDRASQYCGHDFQNALKGYEMKAARVTVGIRAYREPMWPPEGGTPA